MESVEENLVELLSQKVREARKQQSRSIPPSPETSTVRQNESTEAKLDIMTACRLEAIESIADKTVSYTLGHMKVKRKT